MAATTTKTHEYVQLKLLINEETNKVVFAQAGKDFVDILCSFLTLPLGTIARLMQKDSNMGPVTLGCLNSLYQSVADLDECLCTKASKEILLFPRNFSEDYCSNLKLNVDDIEPIKYYMCGDEYCVNERSSHYLSTSVHDKCAECGSRYDRPVFPKSFVKGFVNNVATFVITDGLFIMPNSMVYPSFSLLQNSGIDTCSAKELTLNVNEEKVLDLLKCALVSQSPLTDVFLREKPSIERYWCSSRCFGNSDHIKITLQLVISKSKRKILFVYGEQDFVDLLFSFLTFPLGGVVRKLGGYSSMANIDRMYASIVELNEDKYLMSKEAKMRLVDPHVVSKFKSNKKILPTVEPRQYLYCHYRGESYKKSIINGQFFVTNEYRSDDRKCVEMHLVKSQKCCAIEEGYVKGPRTYLITDDLVIEPSSSISALLLTNRLQIPLDDLKEKVVMIGLKERLNILKAALTTTSALTNGLSHLLTVTEKN